MSDLVLVDVIESSRWEARAGEGLAGFAEYVQLDPRTRVFTHTVVDPAHRDEGIGSTLIRAAMEGARATGTSVVAQCQFVVAFLADHPEYSDVVAEGRR